MPFLPTCFDSIQNPDFDFILVSCDAYVDHPSFGHAIVSRLVESLGFTIGIIPQPKSEKEYRSLGTPKYAFLVSGGVVDSMVNNYSVNKVKRKEDVYSPGGKSGGTPDRAVTVHTNKLRKYFADSYIIIGGVESSLRRFAHYDYWNDSVMPSLLMDANADLLIYGMGESPITQLLTLVKKGVDIRKIKDVRGTCYAGIYENLTEQVQSDIKNNVYAFLPTYDEVNRDKLAYVKSFNILYKNSESGSKPLIQKNGKTYIISNAPSFPLDIETMDKTYALPYEYNYHPHYTEGVPAITEVRFSVTSHRGCFGACSYCSIAFLQGRRISKRSKESIVAEVEKLTTFPDFKGYIHDLSAPTANFRSAACKKQQDKGTCTDRFCLGYEKCPNLTVDHSEWIDILRATSAVKGVKKVFIRSGIRYDYLQYDTNFRRILAELVEKHISGQLKVAPEHCSDNVLKVMNKPRFDVYKRFKDVFTELNAQKGLKQFLVPYLISSHPEATTKDAIELAEYLKSINYMPLQVQDFYPTPSTRSTTMFYTGIDPFTMKEVYVAKDATDKQTQRAFLQYRLANNYQVIKEALIKNKRLDLIGNTKKCLIK